MQPDHDDYQDDMKLAAQLHAAADKLRDRADRIEAKHSARQPESARERARRIHGWGVIGGIAAIVGGGAWLARYLREYALPATAVTAAAGGAAIAIGLAPTIDRSRPNPRPTAVPTAPRTEAPAAAPPPSAPPTMEPTTPPESMPPILPSAPAEPTTEPTGSAVEDLPGDAGPPPAAYGEQPHAAQEPIADTCPIDLRLLVELSLCRRGDGTLTSVIR